MGRVSQEQSQLNRARIVGTAARLFRERGVAAVSVADVTAAAGLTHGGFYKHFASKEALVAEAVTRAFQESGERLAGQDRALGHAAARQDFIDGYLSAAHRDGPGDGCPSAGFGPDVARSGHNETYVKGVEGYAAWLDGDLAALSTLVGAVILARATAGTPLSDRILDAARTALDDHSGQPPARPE